MSTEHTSTNSASSENITASYDKASVSVPFRKPSQNVVDYAWKAAITCGSVWVLGKIGVGICNALGIDFSKKGDDKAGAGSES